MSIRIWHQSFTVLSDLGAYDEALRAHFRKVARPGTQIHMHGMLPGTYRNNYPGDDIKYSALQYLHGLQFMAAGINAQDQGFDAYAISTLPEPALKEKPSLLDNPVVGYGESAMLTACMLGRTFGVLVFINDGFALVWLLVVSRGLLFEAGDSRVSQWIADISMFLLEENRAASAPLEGSRETDSTNAYLQQFEHPAGTQWLPHSY